MFNKLINVSITAESITNCDTKKFFNRSNLYFTITYTQCTYIMITICKNLLFVFRFAKASSMKCHVDLLLTWIYY